MKVITRILLFIFLFAVSNKAVYAQLKTTVVDSSQQIADSIIKSEVPVLVDFWAAWCGPCKMLNPIISGLKKEFKGKIKVMKINVDHHKQIASYFRVTSIPMVYIIDEKTVKKRIIGVRSKEDYIQAIKEVLAAKKEKKDVENKSTES